MKKILVCFFFYAAAIYAKDYPADISYMVADLKYSMEHGIKICEVQHGALSAMNGDLYINGGNGIIAEMIVNYFDHFPMQKWVAGSLYSPLRNSLIASGFQSERSIKTLCQNSTFLEIASTAPENPFTISSYKGIVFATTDIYKDLNKYKETYPGVLFIDAVTLPYWVDKYKMNKLFKASTELNDYKADFELCQKKYDPSLAEKIQEKMPSDLYVIKPRCEFLANGVIIVAKEELDSTLKLILEPLPSLKHNPEKNYSYWLRNKDDSFLIEKYYMSDTLQDGNYHYDATMRIAFILEYDNGKMSYQFLGGFWKLPCKALQEDGTLNEKRISFCAAPFYRAVEPNLLEEVSIQLEKAMLLLYEVMLNNRDVLNNAIGKLKLAL